MGTSGGFPINSFMTPQTLPLYGVPAEWTKRQDGMDPFLTVRTGS